MTYEENLRKTAEEIYNEAPDIKRWRDIEAFFPIAEYCLKKQAEVYRDGWNKSREGSMLVDPLTNELKQLGLIP